jgi:uncharacterized membrane protein YbhN (UPF0104 family)
MLKLKRWHRVAISILALAILLRFIPLRALVGAMTQVPAGVLGVALVVFILGHVVAAMKWRMLQGAGAGLPILATLRAHFAGVLANLWLPGVVGGDLVRVSVVFRQAHRPASIALASLVDRIIDSAALVCLALAGLVALGAPAHEARRAFIIVVGAGVLGLVGLLVAYRLAKLRLLAHGKLAQLDEAIGLLKRRPLAVVGAFFLSGAVQTAFILVNEQLGRSIGVQVPTAVWFMAWPLSKMVALVPVSAAGIGVREAAIVVLMRPFTRTTDAVMASSLLWQGLLFAGGFLGWSALSLASMSARVGERRVLSSPRE